VQPVEYIRRWQDEFVALRRDLHAHPELGFEEERTGRVVRETLASLGIEHHVGIGRTGIVAVVRGQRDSAGRSVGLRADMDALPMQEENDFAHRSRYDGRMHGCGLGAEGGRPLMPPPPCARCAAADRRRNTGGRRPG
jgi:hippurate hydrolase